MYCWTNMFLCFLFMLILILILTLLKIGATDLACSYLFSGMQPQEHRIHSWGCCIYRSRNQGIMKCSTCISIGNRTFIVKNEVLWIKRITIFVSYHKFVFRSLVMWITPISLFIGTFVSLDVVTLFSFLKNTSFLMHYTCFYIPLSCLSLLLPWRVSGPCNVIIKSSVV